MPTWLSPLLIFLAGVGVVGLLVVVMLLATRPPANPEREHSAASVSTNPAWWSKSALSQDASPEGEAPPSPRANEWTHTAPEQPFSVDEAHHEMQQHRDCLLDNCNRKSAAFNVLVEAGRATTRKGSGRTPEAT